MKNKKKIKQNIISHFNKRKNGDVVNIVPKDKNPIPNIIKPIEKEKQEQPKNRNYIPTEFNESILKLNKKIEFIANRQNDYLNTNTTTEKHYNTDTINNNTVEKHYNTDTRNNSATEKHYNTDTRNNKTVNNTVDKTVEKHYNTDTRNNQRIINIPKEIKIPSAINPVSIEEKGLNKETKNIKNVQNNIKKMLFHNNRNETKHNVRNNKNIKSITNNTLPSITNNTHSKNPTSFTVNKTNISNKALSRILERNTDTNNKTNNKYFTIDKSTVTKMLSGKVQVPNNIPAYAKGGPVEKQFGGKLIIAGDSGVDEMVTPLPNIKSTLKTNAKGEPQIIREQQLPSLSSAAKDSMSMNAVLKQEQSMQPNSTETSQSPTIINNTTNNSGGGEGKSPQGFGGGTKASESMGLQTQYPIWRRGFG